MLIGYIFVCGHIANCGYANYVTAGASPGWPAPAPALSTGTPKPLSRRERGWGEGSAQAQRAPIKQGQFCSVGLHGPSFKMRPLTRRTECSPDQNDDIDQRKPADVTPAGFLLIQDFQNPSSHCPSQSAQDRPPVMPPLRISTSLRIAFACRTGTGPISRHHQRLPAPTRIQAVAARPPATLTSSQSIAIHMQPFSQTTPDWHGEQHTLPHPESKDLIDWE